MRDKCVNFLYHARFPKGVQLLRDGGNWRLEDVILTFP